MPRFQRKPAIDIKIPVCIACYLAGSRVYQRPFIKSPHSSLAFPRLKQNLPLRLLCPVWNKGRLSQICGATEGSSAAKCLSAWIPALFCSCPCLLFLGMIVVVWLLCMQERSDDGEKPHLCAHMVTRAEKCPGWGGVLKVLAGREKLSHLQLPTL